MDGAKFGSEAHFMFSAVKNGIEGSNFYDCYTVIATVKMSCKRSVGIVANDSTPILIKPCPQQSSNLSDMKHGTFTA